jgi:hypothetical protein
MAGRKTDQGRIDDAPFYYLAKAGILVWMKRWLR